MINERVCVNLCEVEGRHVLKMSALTNKTFHTNTNICNLLSDWATILMLKINQMNAAMMQEMIDLTPIIFTK